MKRHYALTFLPIFFLLLNPNHSKACTCGVIPRTLCESINDRDNQEVVLIKTLSFSLEFTGYSFEETTRAVVLDGLKNDALAGDTITILSGNDSACEGSLYEPSDTMLLVLYESYGDNQYTYPSCGNFLAGYRNDTLFLSSGNDSQTIAYSAFKDNFDDCIALKPQMNVTGQITNWRYGNAISDLNFTIDGTDLTTDVNGAFTYYGLGYEGPEFEYTVTPISNDGLTRGISTADVVMTSRHILGTERFFRAEQYLAADVNNSHSVTTLDLIYLRRVILGIDNFFPNNNSWRFLKRGHQFPQTDNPWLEEIPEYGTTEIISSNLINIRPEDIELRKVYISAIKVGDVDGSI